MSGFPTVDVDAELAVLAAVLSDPEALLELDGRVRVTDFAAPAHAAVFAAALACEADGHSPDRITIGNYLERAGKLPDVVSPDFLESLFTGSAESANLHAHAEVVRDRSLKRQVHRVARTLAQEAGSPQSTGQDAVAVAEREILKLGDFGPGAAEVITVGASLSELVSDIREADGDEMIGVPTGFRELDQKTSGLQPGQLAILAARPGLGKTTMALQMACTIAKSTGERVLILSHEMTHKELSARLLSMYMDCSLRDLRSGRALAQDEEKLLAAVEEISTLPIELVDAPPKTVSGLRSLIRRQARREPIGSVMIDYIQMMDERSDNRNRSDVLGEIIYEVKSLAKEIEAPFIVLSQLNRGIENRIDKRPTSADLRESGALEQAADIIWFLHRPGASDPDADPEEAELFMTKQRNGESNLSIKLRWNTRSARYENPRVQSSPYSGPPPTHNLPNQF